MLVFPPNYNKNSNVTYSVFFFHYFISVPTYLRCVFLGATITLCDCCKTCRKSVKCAARLTIAIATIIDKATINGPVPLDIPKRDRSELVHNLPIRHMDNNKPDRAVSKDARSIFIFHR